MWDWSAKKTDKNNIKDNTPAEENEFADEGKTPVYSSDYGYRKDADVNNYQETGESEMQQVLQIAKKVKFETPDIHNIEVPPAEDDEKWAMFEDDIPSTERKDSGNISSYVEQVGEVKENGNKLTVDGERFIAPKIVDLDDNSSIWEWQFSTFNLPSMELIEAHYSPLDVSTRMEFRRNFRKIRRDFLRYIAYYNKSELEEVGIEDKGIRSLKKGKAPENYDVHLKVPYEYGGDNEFTNLLFIQTHPFHEDIHRFLDMQTTSQPFGCQLSKLYIPFMEGRVYVPKDSSALGGGKGKGDKTSVQGFSTEALQQLAVKSSMDRGAGK